MKMPYKPCRGLSWGRARTILLGEGGGRAVGNVRTLVQRGREPTGSTMERNRCTIITKPVSVHRATRLSTPIHTTQHTHAPYSANTGASPLSASSKVWASSSFALLRAFQFLSPSRSARGRSSDAALASTAGGPSPSANSVIIAFAIGFLRSSLMLGDAAPPWLNRCAACRGNTFSLSVTTTSAAGEDGSIVEIHQREL